MSTRPYKRTEVQRLAEWLVDKAEEAFPFPGELDLLIADDIAKAVISSDWLTVHDTEVSRKAHREGYTMARQDMISGAFIGGPTYEALRGSFTGRRIASEVARKAKAEALREAAGYAGEGLGTGLGGNDWFPTKWAGQVDGWLNERANKIESGEA